MDRYLLTHSLMYSWLYAIKENPYEDMTTERDPMKEFVSTLNRVETPPTEAMRKGIGFENLVTDIICGKGDPRNRWFEAASEVARIVGGGLLQYKASRTIHIGDMTFLLYGRLDALHSGEIFDIKYSGSYDRGKYLGSTQHPTYLELVPEANGFTYVVSNGTDVWTERYRRDETPSILPTIANFVDRLQTMDLLEVYKSHWLAK